MMAKCGIKCENHTGNIVMLGGLFGAGELHKIISDAKKERIDKQYYVDFEVSKKDVEELIDKSKQFITKMKLMIESLKNEDVDNIRKKFDAIV